MKLALQVEPDTLEGPGEVAVRWNAKGASTVLLSALGRVHDSGERTLRIVETTTLVVTAFAPGRARCTQQTVTVAERNARGVIVPWWGNGEPEPEGWTVCDGRDGTPDLRGRFIRGTDREPGPVEPGRHAHSLPARTVEGTTAWGGAHDHVAAGWEPQELASRGGHAQHTITVRGAGAAWTGGAHEHELRLDLPAVTTNEQPDPLPLAFDLVYLMKR